MSDSQCYIGSLIDDECHLKSLSKKTCLHNLKDLPSDNLILLEYRVQTFTKESQGFICDHHKVKYLDYYSSLQR